MLVLSFQACSVMVFFYLMLLNSNTQAQPGKKKNEIDLELRLAPPGQRNGEPTQLPSENRLPSSPKAIITNSDIQQTAHFNKIGRPRLISHNESTKRRRESLRKASKKFVEDIKQDENKYKEFLEAKRESNKRYRKKVSLDPIKLAHQRKMEKRKHEAKKLKKKLEATKDSIGKNI
jgi:hypothetical protein